MLEERTVRSPICAGASESEFRFTEADFAEITSILYDEAGISLPEGKAPLVYARLAKRLRQLGLDNFADYIALLRERNAPERKQLVVALTTNVTRFFREPHHFEHLREQVLDPLIARPRHGARLRLWSAACSTGQEAYSIAATVAENLRDGDLLDVKILATDIDNDVLLSAERGRYESLDGVPAPLRRWFVRDGAEWLADDRLRKLITFRYLNLNAPWPVKGPFDAVLCRNVAIYFDQQVQSRLWANFAKIVKPDGFLYIGHSERLGGPAATMFDSVGITTYRRLRSVS